MLNTFQLIANELSDHRLPDRLAGWCTLDKANALAITVFALRPAVAVEIGAYAGRSVLPVALAMKEVGRGVIYAIDPWLPEASAEGYDKVNADWWKTVSNLTGAKVQFDAMVKTLGVAHIVVTEWMKSDDVKPPAVIDLLHIDGQHTEQAQRDVRRFGCNVRPGGIVFMDDVSWKNAGREDVRHATAALLELGFVKLYGMYGSGNDFEVYQKVKA